MRAPASKRWNEDMIRGMHLLSTHAARSNVRSAYGLSRTQLRQAAGLTAQMLDLCENGSYIGPKTWEMFVMLAPLRRAVIETEHQWPALLTKAKRAH